MRLRSVPDSQAMIAVIVPALNEEASLPSLFEEVARQREEWRERGLKVQLWVINDGSQDQTHALLAQTLDLSPQELRWIEHPLNLGIGKTVQTGLRAALAQNADVLVQMDGDGQHPPGELARLVEPILMGRADWVIGSRYLPEHRTNVSSRFREWGTGLFSLWVQLLTGTRIYDTTSGFRAWSRKAALEIVARYPDDYPEVQSLIIARQLGHQIFEVPVQMKNRGRGSSSITPLRSAYYMVKVLLATGVEALRTKELRR